MTRGARNRSATPWQNWGPSVDWLRYNDPRTNPSCIAKTVFVPMPTDAVPGEVKDTNSKPFDERLPRRFILGDGGLTRCFIGVDLSAGSALNARLDQVMSRIPQREGRYEAEDVIEWVRTHVTSIIGRTPGAFFNDGRAEFDWDRNIETGELEDDFSAVAFNSIDDPPRLTVPLETFPVVPFEKYLEAGRGYCIQKALLAALILDRIGVPFRLVNGAVDAGPGQSTGHVWIELADGRVLDATWGQISSIKETHEDHPNWFRFGGSFRFANQRYPYLVIA